MSDTLLQELLDAGTPAMLVVKVAQEIARLQADAEKLARRRETDRERQASKRGSGQTGNNVTSRDIADVADTPPLLDKETLPPTPPFKEINPPPRVTPACALARKASGFGPPAGVELSTWNAFCGQRRKPLSVIAYNRMLNTLAESSDAGWPPGEVVERAIEKGWETLFTPSERSNGNRTANHHDDGLGRSARAAISVFGAPERPVVEPEAETLRRVGPSRGEPSFGASDARRLSP